MSRTSEEISRRNARELAVIEAIEKAFGYKRSGEWRIFLRDPKLNFLLSFNAYERERYRSNQPIYVRVKADPNAGYWYGRKDPWIVITEKEDTPEKIAAKFEKDLLPKIMAQVEQGQAIAKERQKQKADKAEEERQQAELMVDVGSTLGENGLEPTEQSDKTFTFKHDDGREFVLQPFKDSVVLSLHGIRLADAIEIIKQYGPNGRREP